MSNFWEKKLSQQPAQNVPQQPIQQSQAASNGPWWRPTPQVPPQPQTVPQEQTEELTELRNTVQAHNKQEQMENCPGCGSGNYAAPPGSRTYGARCFDCGYPVMQSGSGMSNTASEGPSRAARQVSTANNYNPHDVSAGTVG